MDLPIKWQKYSAIFEISILHTIKNYKLLIGLCIFEVTCLLIFAHIWKVAVTKDNIVSLDPLLLLWYIAFNEWILIAVPDIEMDIEYELKTGQLAYCLPRPMSYLGAKLAEGMGALLLNLVVLGFVAFAFTYFWTGSLPLPPLFFIVIILLGVLGGFLSLVFTMIVGLTAFFVEEVEPWRWIWEKFLFVLGGLMLPLTVYPAWIQQVASWTPFPSILGNRSALIFNFEFSAIMGVLFSLLLWSAIGLSILYLLFKKGLKILNMEGG